MSLSRRGLILIVHGSDLRAVAELADRLERSGYNRVTIRKAAQDFEMLLASYPDFDGSELGGAVLNQEDTFGVYLIGSSSTKRRSEHPRCRND